MPDQTPAARLSHAPGRPVSSSMRPINPAAFGFDQARHLLWRAGFGGTPEQIQTFVAWGPQKSVEYLTNYSDIPGEAVTENQFDRNIMRPASREERELAAKARRMSDEDTVARLRARRQEAERDDRRQMSEVQRWWFKRMIETPRPLEEKMTLFWHGHFATSYRTIEDSYHMFTQNQLFRKHAVGDFRELLFAVIRDPAMLAYLDNDDSRKGRPNENLAREIMELFALGVGNYSEQDIKEGARALTGYSFKDDEFDFQKNNHDDGRKSILGKSGAMDGDDFVKAILEQRACSRFLAAKFYHFFIGEHPTGRPDRDAAAKSVIADLASTILASKYRVRPVLEKLFLSEHFYDAAVVNERIKSPVELVVGAVRSLNAPVRDLGVLAAATSAMGQNVFFPPSVKGWDGGRSWINTSTLFIRQNIMCFLLTGKLPVGYDALKDVEKFDPSPLLEQLARTDSAAASSPEAVVDYLLRFATGAPAQHNRATLQTFLKDHGGKITPDSITGLLLLITAMPEYQLC